MKVRVLITRRPGILDPEGRAVARALNDLGFDEVSGVGTGKLLVLDLPDSLSPAQVESRVREMCDKLLANPVMEQYAIEPLGG
jgi:phosphoribosylformylglycinamidine synthase subunit PurS